MNIMFVCTGNSCRSPMAEGILKSLAGDEFNVSSAGISAYTPHSASDNAVSAMDEMGIDISDHISTQITHEIIAEADLVLTMTAGHKHILIDLLPDHSDRIYTLKEFAYGEEGDVADPYGGDMDVYRDCAGEIKDAVYAVYDKLTSSGDKI